MLKVGRPITKDNWVIMNPIGNIFSVKQTQI